MKKYYRSILTIILAVILFTNCDDKVIETYIANVPIYITYDELRSSVQVGNSRVLQNPGKIYFYNNYLFINEYLKGIHIIDNSNPAAPINLHFISIPGNVDITIKDDILYADSYIDIVALNISDINNITEANRLENILPYILPPYDKNYRIDEIDYSKGVVVDWELKKITRNINEQRYPVYPWFYNEDYMISSYSNGTSGSSLGSSSSFGIGGSMSRFAAINNVLYAIDNYSLNIIDITDYNNLSLLKSLNIGWNIKTIFPFDNKLFIGSQNGMLIYDISIPSNPTFISDYWHITSCDPVIIDGDYAYVTLRSGNLCGEASNQLDVIDISNLTSPTLVRSYPMTEPYGLGIDKSTLFICDGSAGLKIYDISDVSHITDNIISVFPDMQSYDVIPVNGILMLIGDDGLYQYDYSDLSDIQLLSSIAIVN